MKRLLFASLAVFFSWAALDFVLHGVLLRSTYEATASLWRPMDEMRMGLMNLSTAVAALCFTGIYAFLGGRGSVAAGVKYGLLFGIAVGFPMGFGSYCYLPIPIGLAWVWFLGTVVEGVAGGAIVGAIAKPES